MPPEDKSERVDIVHALPTACAVKVLSLLEDHRDVAAASSVCRRWRQVVQEEAVWEAAWEARFPPWGSERALSDATQQAVQGFSWAERYRWRLGIDRCWVKGRRRLAHALDNHHAWVNAVRLVPGAGVASGGSEGAVNFWSLDVQLQHHDTTHSQAVWALDADPSLIVSGAMDGWVNVLDLASGAVSHRLPVGWRGAAGLAVDALDWQNFDVVTTVQLLPGGATVVAGCMDGVIQLLDLRCSARQQPAAAQVAWGQQAAAGAAEGGQRFWWRGRASSRLCAARCHENLLVAGGDAAAVSLHDLRMGGACFAELALPAGDGGSVRTPAVFAMDLLWPRLATGGDRGQVQVWDLSRLDAAPGVLPPVSPSAQPLKPRLLYNLWGGTSADGGGGGSSSSAAPPPQRPLPAAAASGWPSPDAPACARRPRGAASSPAASSVDSLIATNEYHLQQAGGGAKMGCIYGVKLLEDWRVLTADHGGHVRLWNARELVGSGPQGLPCLTSCPAFAPSVDDPASALIDLEGGPMRPVGMHCLDACLTHLAVAGRDSVVRLYSYEGA